MSEPRLIKKYANRRLYDTVASRHITLDGLRRLIVDGEDIRVVDDTSGEDITRTLLLQVIAEQEQAGAPLLDAALLTKLIRIYGDPMQSIISDYLLRSIENFSAQQDAFQKQMRQAMRVLPLEAMRDLADRNLDAWQKWQDALLGASGARRDDKPE